MKRLFYIAVFCMLFIGCKDDEKKVLVKEIPVQVSKKNINQLTVQLVEGVVEFQTKEESKWLPAKTGKKIKLKTTIRTDGASQIELVSSDGSMFKLFENTTVTLTKLLIDSITRNIELDIKHGKVGFSVKRLINQENSKVEFKSPYAVAAIRGTEGAILVGNKKFAAFLKTGKLAVRQNGSSEETIIEKKQMATLSGSKFTVKKLTEKELGKKDESVSSSIIENVLEKLEWSEGDLISDLKGQLESKLGAELSSTVVTKSQALTKALKKNKTIAKKALAETKKKKVKKAVNQKLSNAVSTANKKADALKLKKNLNAAKLKKAKNLLGGF